MGDADQEPGPLPQTLGPQVGDAVFRDDVVDICAGGGDCGAGLKHRDDPGHFPVLGRRGHGQNGLAVWTHGRAPDIFQLTADAGELLGTHGLRVYLAVEIHLQAGVDGHDFGILADHGGVVHIVHGPH